MFAELAKLRYGGEEMLKSTVSRIIHYYVMLAAFAIRNIRVIVAEHIYIRMFIATFAGKKLNQINPALFVYNIYGRCDKEGTIFQ